MIKALNYTGEAKLHELRKLLICIKTFVSKESITEKAVSDTYHHSKLKCTAIYNLSDDK